MIIPAQPLTPTPNSSPHPFLSSSMRRSLFTLRRHLAAKPLFPSHPRPLRRFSSAMEDPSLKEFTDYMEKLKNYERVGVPKDAGTDSDDGFDLGRVRRLLRRLGDPHLDFQAVHVVGTKGKGSTTAFLSSILREAGYSVGCYTSPHLLTIRERISVGRHGEPVPAVSLVNLLRQIKDIIDESVEHENGALTHFEVLTTIALTLFSQEKINIAIIEAGLGGARDATNVLTNTGLAAAVITTIAEEHLAALGGSLESIAEAKAGVIKQGRPVVIGGPFESHIESILRRKASSMSSPVVSASDPGIRSKIKKFGEQGGRPYQSCDIHMNVAKDLPLLIELNDVKLRMLGDHQLQNAVTATCTALCLRDQGWNISDGSIRAGLEQAMLPGRCQILTDQEVETIDLSGAHVMIDGAHTEASAKSLAETIRKTCEHEAVALIVAMAIDKDHVAFSRQLLSGLKPEIVLLSEVNIAESRSRMTPASSLKKSWLCCATDLGIDVLDIGDITYADMYQNVPSLAKEDKKSMLIGCETESIKNSLKAANQLLRFRCGERAGLIVVTGSLHIVSSVLSAVS